jgi:hypothetical protein
MCYISNKGKIGKFIKNKKYLKYFYIRSIIGLFLVFLAVVLLSFNLISSSLFSVFLSIGIVLSLISYIRYKKIKCSDCVLKDERTIKITLYSANYSWFYTILAILVLFWLDYLKLVIFSVQQIIIIIYLIMVISVILCKIYFNNKKIQL